MNKMPWKVWKTKYFVLEKSGKPQSNFCTNLDVTCTHSSSVCCSVCILLQQWLLSQQHAEWWCQISTRF